MSVDSNATTTEVESSSNSTESSITANFSTIPPEKSTRILLTTIGVDSDQAAPSLGLLDIQKPPLAALDSKYLNIKPPKLLMPSTNHALIKPMLSSSVCTPVPYLTSKMDENYGCIKANHYSKITPQTAAPALTSPTSLSGVTASSTASNTIGPSKLSGGKTAPPLLEASIYPQFIKLVDTSANFKLADTKKLLPINRNRIQSDCDINFIIEPTRFDHHLNESIYSSNDEDNEVFIKLNLKEAEMVI